MTTAQTTRVFVYGTLKRGHRNHRRYIAPHRTQIVPASVQGAVLYEGDAYPMLLPGDGTVRGELVTFLDASAWPVALAHLDMLEGVDPGGDDGLYRRELWPVTTEHGSVDAWVYVWNSPLDGLRLVEGGEWHARSHR
jgi:gamma-glutamylcyclotransferase (GGCT)/AIG2-like uncharacterized protein YtfP